MYLYRSIYIYIYVSVMSLAAALLLKLVAFGLLQRVDSQKSMLTWPEALQIYESRRPCRLNLCQSGTMTKMRNHSGQ